MQSDNGTEGQLHHFQEGFHSFARIFGINVEILLLFNCMYGQASYYLQSEVTEKEKDKKKKSNIAYMHAN